MYKFFRFYETNWSNTRIVSESLKANNLTSHDIDENTPNKINCQNYTVDEFSNLERNLNPFDLFHSDVNGLSS